MIQASSRLVSNRAGKADLAFKRKKVFMKLSLAGGLFLSASLSLASLTASAEEASPAPAVDDRARLIQELRDLRLPPILGYHDPFPQVVARVPARQYDVEETPRVDE